MDCNLKLKHAVTAALGLIAFGFQSSSLALGLSDIQVESHLGEPLKAKLNVLGATDLKDTSCLKLGPKSDLSHVNFKLGQINGGNANLILLSNRAINEPIVNLSIVAGCDNTITRDYVLLLDPPTSLLSTKTEINAIESVVPVQKVDNTAKTSTKKVIDQQNVTRTQQSKSHVKKAKSKKKAKTSAKKSIGVTRVTHQAPVKKKIAAAQPRLSISSGFSAPYASSTGLRLDKQLRTKPNPSAAFNGESIAIEDEVTVMNHRLTHLQAQILQLQKQNAQLKTDNQFKAKQLDQTQASEPGILPFLGAGILGASLLAAIYTGLNWLRRRRQLLQNHHTEAIWLNTSEEHDDKEGDTAVKSVEEENIFSDVDFGISDDLQDSTTEEPSMESIFESTKTEELDIVLEDEQQFSVLDHADVFLSHGRATLAIQLLQDHLIENPKQSVTIWLFLLDLLAKESLEEQYKEAANDCKLHFNVKIADYSDQESSTSESLEDFPRLAQGLESVWNTPNAIIYLDDLIYNNRLEPRAGLPKTLIEELVLLKSMALENASSAEVIQLDEKKLAIIEQKEALLEQKKVEKRKKMEEEALKKSEEADNTETTEETSFEFTLVER